MENKRSRYDLADILREHRDVFYSNYRMFEQQKKAYRNICACRTPELGGHTNYCNSCDYNSQAYNSCRNKHCPKCQFIKQVRWVDKLRAKLPACKHFHLVLTIPHRLNELFYLNQNILYNALFQSAWKAVSKAADNPSFLGAQTGAVAVLHTWTQTLGQHPHIHMIIPAGGLSEDQMEWIPAHKDFFAPKKAISRLFRGILCERIGLALEQSVLNLPDGFDWKQVKQHLYKSDWNVNIKKPMASIDSVIEYLGRYTNRVAINNSRITAIENGKVFFRYKNRKTGIHKVMKLEALEFIRRFMLHILPHNFYKIRYYGILSSANSQSKMKELGALLEKCVLIPRFEGLPAMDVYSLLTGKDVSRCPKCKSGRILCRSLPDPDT
ncbi:IS91 family transposase [Marinifilum fragile]|uniref:IS91 family transposase n=1 Tax=Marinifilum fragile TaxID=570161 RepID=UPI002AA61EB7|nr:IS91 family transposase [Marinifilum fragile]